MITIGTVKFDFESDNESFARELYGRWDSFASTSVEKVADDVLSRYDTPEQEIIIESLELDLGEIEEDGFYDRFPKVLADRLEMLFSSYILNKDGHPGEISIIPTRQSRLSGFIYFMTHGWWPWTGEEGALRLADLLVELIGESPAEISGFFWEDGPSRRVRRRLVSQFNDTSQERLLRLMIPSDAAFIYTYVQFVRGSYTRLSRPEIVETDFRDAVWMVVWAYLLTESKGYFSRKQMIVGTLARLSAYYNLPARSLLEILTHHLRELSSIRQVLPDLLLILEEIREEAVSVREAELPPDYLGKEELRAVLSRPESARVFLGRLPEEGIYRVTERLLPLESPFIIRYAQSLDKEKELGMLEGKAGKEFRIVKWVLIFQVLFMEPGDLIERKRFVSGVLKMLASHYNLTVMELLGYFYRTLSSGRIQVRPELRELIVALYLDAIEESPAAIPPDFPDELIGILSDIRLCHRFLLPLSEEEIYPLVRRAIPPESEYILLYARTLDRGKERGMLEGKAGGEFRILKWEFIFQVVFSVPVATFSRKQFTRSVLSSLAGHYNLSLSELVSYFYQATREKETWIPETIRAVIAELYEETLLESPEPLLTGPVNEERMIVLLEKFVLNGQIPRGETGETVKVFAFLLKWAVRLYGPVFGRKEELLVLLRDILDGRKSADAARIRELVVSCVKRQAGLFECQLDALIPAKGIAVALPKRGRQEAVASPAVEKPADYPYPLNPAYRLVVEEVVRLLRQGSFGADEDVWLECLSCLADHRYRNLSAEGLLSVFWQRLSGRLPEARLWRVGAFIRRHTDDLPVLSRVLPYFMDQKENEMKDEWKEKVCLSVANAGLVLVSPYLPMLFHRLGLLEESRRGFKDADARVKAIFAMQRLLTDEEETPESELTLNKVIAGYGIREPLPRSSFFKQEELELIASLLKAIMMNWDKMRNTSLRGFRDSFLIRAGKLEEGEERWDLKVSEKAFDVLLDTLPWGFKMIKNPWMEKPLFVNWR